MNRVNVVDAFELTPVEWALVEFTNSNLDAITRHISWLSEVHVMKWRDGKTPTEERPVNFRFFQSAPRQLPLAAAVLEHLGYIPIPSYEEARDVANFCSFVSAKLGRTLSNKKLTYIGWFRKTGKRISAFHGRSETYYRKRLRTLLRVLEAEHERIHGQKKQMLRVKRTESVENFLNRIAVVENHLDWWRRTQNCKAFIASLGATPVQSGSIKQVFDLKDYQGEALTSAAIDRRMAQAKIREILPPKRGDLVMLEEVEDYAREALKELQFGYGAGFYPEQYLYVPRDEFNYKWYLRRLVEELESVVRATAVVCNSWDSDQSRQALRELTLVEDFVQRLEKSDAGSMTALVENGLNADLAEDRSHSILENRFRAGVNFAAPSEAEVDDVYRFSAFVEEFRQSLMRQEILKYSVYRMRAVPPKKWLKTTYGGRIALLARLPVFSLEGKQLVRSRDGQEMTNPVSDGAIREWICNLNKRIETASKGLSLPYRKADIPETPVVIVHCDIYSVEWSDRSPDPVWDSYVDWEVEVEGPDFLSDLGFEIS